MIRRISLVTHFALRCLVCLAVAVAVGGWGVTRAVEESALARARDVTAAVVAREIVKEVPAEVFATPQTGERYQAFAETVEHLTLGPRVVQVKLWGQGAVVIWSRQEELVGRRFPDNPELWEAFEGNVEAELSGLEKSENRYERPYGRLLELYVPIRYGAGPVVGVAEVYEDISPVLAEVARLKRRVWGVSAVGAGLVFLVLLGVVVRADRRIREQTLALERSEERFRTLVESAPDPIVETDADGRVVFANRAACDLLGLGGRGPALPCLLDLAAEADREAFRGWLCPARGQGERLEVRFQGAGGKEIPARISGAVREVEGGPVHTLILRDLRREKALEASLVESERRAALAALAASIGHEMNNALAVVVAGLERLEEAALPGDLRKYVAWLAAATEELSIHARNLLELGKPRPPAFGAVDPNELVERNVEVLTRSGVLKRVAVRMRPDRGAPLVWADPALLDQVVRNLLINAVHAVGGTGTLEIGVRRRPEGGAEIFVADDGPGLPPGAEEKVFEPFFTTKPAGEGTGLGLYISRQIVREHGGDLALENRPEGGAVARIQLPSAREAA
ncbi:two-component system sensor histidine kinase NtrB [Deferrisoma palaeochoriense]